MVDEVTDISNVQNLLTFIRFYHMEKRMTVSEFANTCDISGESEITSADALSIFLCLKNVLGNNLDLNSQELIEFCLDGASVMTGKDNGVAARFKQLEECSGMLSVHCICHRLALACGDTGDDLKFISDFETMIQLWTFLKNSPKLLKTYIKTAMRLKEFEDLPRAQQRSLVQKVKKAVRTKWLSLDAGVEAVYKDYTYLLHALRSMKDDEGASTGASAPGVLKKVDDMKFLAVLYVLKFTLLALSETFQSGELNFSRIKPAIEKVTHRIKNLAKK